MFKGHKDNGGRTKAVKYDPSRDANLSFHAKGILYYLLLRPYNWNGQLYDIVQYGADSEHMVRKGIKELVEAGYMKRHHAKEDGKFKGSYYEYADAPIFKK